jgi:hypothetical protein
VYDSTEEPVVPGTPFRTGKVKTEDKRLFASNLSRRSAKLICIDAPSLLTIGSATS